jgi:polyadenylate-binding protein
VEREKELRMHFDKIKRDRMNKYQGVNLYVKNLDDSIDDERLRKEFEHCGTIASCVVMRDDKTKLSKGFGFICFTNPEDATKAIAEMNGKMIVSKPVYVALAERKDQRRAKLEAQHAQRGMALRMVSGMPGGPHMAGAPGMYPPGPMPYPYGPGRGAFIPGYPMMNRRPYPQRGGPQGGVGMPQGMPGMPGGFMPMGGPGGQGNQGGQVGAVQGGAGGGVPRGMSRGRGGPPPQKGGAPGVPMGPGGVIPNQPQMYPGIKYNPNVRNQQPTLSMDAMANMSVQERKQTIGEALFPLITNSLKSLNQEDLSGKITGMLLESMDPAELLDLLDNSKLMDGKIAEALEVLELDKSARTA